MVLAKTGFFYKMGLGKGSGACLKFGQTENLCQYLQNQVGP